MKLEQKELFPEFKQKEGKTNPEKWGPVFARKTNSEAEFDGETWKVNGKTVDNIEKLREALNSLWDSLIEKDREFVSALETLPVEWGPKYFPNLDKNRDSSNEQEDYIVEFDGENWKIDGKATNNFDALRKVVGPSWSRLMEGDLKFKLAVGKLRRKFGDKMKN